MTATERDKFKEWAELDRLRREASRPGASQGVMLRYEIRRAELGGSDAYSWFLRTNAVMECLPAPGALGRATGMRGRSVRCPRAMPGRRPGRTQAWRRFRARQRAAANRAALRRLQGRSLGRRGRPRGRTGPKVRPVSPKTGKPIPDLTESPIPSKVLTDAQQAVKHINNNTKPSWGGKWGAKHGNYEGNLPKTDGAGNPITYKEYYLPKSAGDTGRLRHNG